MPAALGRTLIAADGPGVIVLADSLWRSQFAADPAVVGRTVRLDGGTVEIVGVMPPKFDADAEFWAPLTVDAGAPRNDRQYSVFARLAPGVTVAEVERELTTISQRLAGDHGATNTGWEAR